MLRRLGVAPILQAAEHAPLAQVRHASKATGGACKYQKRPSKKKPVGFKERIGSAVRGGDVLRTQRHRFEQPLYHREPGFHAGRNVTMDEKRYTLKAEVPGVMSIRHSKIDPAYKWVDVEADIQKEYRTRELRGALPEDQVSTLSPRVPSYEAELHDHNERDWRLRVMAVAKTTERFQDPNLFARGLSDSNVPRPRYTYE